MKKWLGIAFLIYFSEHALAGHRVGDGGDPLMLIFQSAQAEAPMAILSFDPSFIPASTPQLAKQWISNAFLNQRQGIRRLAADVAASRHVWLTDGDVEFETCARTNVPPSEPGDSLLDVYLSLNVCEKRLELGGSSLASQLLIHEAMHHFGISGSPEDEALATQVGQAIMSAYFATQGGRTVNWTFTPSSHRPDGRTDHAAVYTGKNSVSKLSERMLVFGGCKGTRDVPFGCGEWLNSGGILDLSVSPNSWQPMQTENAPEPRSLHSGVWTGDFSGLAGKFLVWGGCGMGVNQYKCSKALNSGGIFDLLSNSWSKMTIDRETPSPRALHSTIWTGEKMVVWGGIENYMDPVKPRLAKNNGSVYFPNQHGGSWSSIDPNLENTPTARFQHSAVWTGREMIIWGGCNELVATGQCNQYFNSGSRYSPETNSWKKMSLDNAPDARRNHAAVWAPSIQKMIVFGGEFEGQYLRTGGIYDPKTDTWQEMNYGGPSERASPQMVWTGDRLVVYGGNGKNDAGQLTFPSDLWQFFPERDSQNGGLWELIKTRDDLQGRTGHSIFWTGRDVLIWGGFSRDQTYQWTGGRIAP